MLNKKYKEAEKEFWDNVDKQIQSRIFEKEKLGETIMEEKKLTDEEIVKALEKCRERPYCEVKCEYKLARTGAECIPKLMGITLDLIHRQKAEIERLTSLYDGKSGYMTSSIGDLPLTVEGLRKAVDEITRLIRVQTELQDLNVEYYNDAKDLRRGNAELQKQVDELKEERYYTEQDTAKEILIPLVKTEKQIDPLKTGIRWSILKGLCKRYGVEVE